MGGCQSEIFLGDLRWNDPNRLQSAKSGIGININFLVASQGQCAFLLLLIIKTLNKQKLHKHLWGGRVSIIPLPATFDTIHLIDIKFCSNNELPLYFQLSVTLWCLNGFHGNHSYINDITSGCHPGFFLSKVEL